MSHHGNQNAVERIFENPFDRCGMNRFSLDLLGTFFYLIDALVNALVIVFVDENPNLGGRFVRYIGYVQVHVASLHRHRGRTPSATYQPTYHKPGPV